MPSKRGYFVKYPDRKFIANFTVCWSLLRVIRQECCCGYKRVCGRKGRRGN